MGLNVVSKIDAPRVGKREKEEGREKNKEEGMRHLEGKEVMRLSCVCISTPRGPRQRGKTQIN